MAKRMLVDHQWETDRCTNCDLRRDLSERAARRYWFYGETHHYAAAPACIARDDKPVAHVQAFADAHDGPGWYYWDDEYGDECSVGAFVTEAEARAHAVDAGYRFEETSP